MIDEYQVLVTPERRLTKTVRGGYTATATLLTSTLEFRALLSLLVIQMNKI